MNRKKVLVWLLVCAAVGILSLIFGVKIYRLDSSNMSSTLKQGDHLILSKFRSKGTISKKYGSIIAFHDPRLFDQKIRNKPIVISRVVGQPGDIIVLTDKSLLVNDIAIPPPVESRRMYRVVTDGSPISEEFCRTHFLEKPIEIDEIGIFDIFLDTLAYQDITSLDNIKQIRPKKMFLGESTMGYWPFSNFFKWNRDQLGPLQIPYKGLSIDISLSNADLYRDIIENHEKNALLIDYRGVHINDHLTSTYTFKNDYYYVLDDNRDHPGNDSRVLGFIPQDHLVGRVKGVLWSSKQKALLK